MFEVEFIFRVKITKEYIDYSASYKIRQFFYISVGFLGPSSKFYRYNGILKVGFGFTVKNTKQYMGHSRIRVDNFFTFQGVLEITQNFGDKSEFSWFDSVLAAKI